jgi:tripartite ATP-independent transporter DctP family solute receptor
LPDFLILGYLGEINSKEENELSKASKTMFVMLWAGLVMLSVFTYAPKMYANSQYVFKMALTDAPDTKIGNEKRVHHCYAAMVAFKESVEKDTKGRMKVELYPYGRLGDNKSYLEQIHAGTLEAALPSEGPIAPFYKDIQVFSVPYLFKDREQLYAILDGKFGKKLYDNMAKRSGLRVLGALENGGFRSFSNSKRLVKTADDMKGLKMRTMDIPVHMEMVKALGAAPTPVAWMELYSALQTGVVDGQENSAGMMVIGSIQEVQKYYTLDKHIMSLSFIVTSERYMKSLPKDIRAALVKAGKKAQQAGRDTAGQNESLALKYIKKSCTVYDPTPAERDTFRKRAQAPCIKWLKANIDHPQWVDELLKMSK